MFLIQGKNIRIYAIQACLFSIKHIYHICLLIYKRKMTLTDPGLSIIQQIFDRSAPKYSLRHNP